MYIYFIMITTAESILIIQYSLEYLFHTAENKY